jgi:sugar/nucleoside kinase (ribokinase family)
MIDLVTIGWLTTDDIVLEDGTCHLKRPGGGALYSAIGASIWSQAVGVHAPAGTAHADASRREIAAWGLDTQGIADAEGNGLELWLLHESDAHKQQVRKLSSSDPLALDKARGQLPASYRGARGFHIAPQGPDSSFTNVRDLRRPGRVLTMDILADAYVDAGRYADLSFLPGLEAFLPSETEILRIWSPARIEDWLSDHARTSTAHMVCKLGAQGSLLAEAGTGKLTHVPAHPVDAVDTTGAGDAYCGGFLAGLSSGYPLEDCGAMGTVSAAFVVEACGALSTRRPSARDRDARLASVKLGITAV